MVFIWHLKGYKTTIHLLCAEYEQVGVNVEKGIYRSIEQLNHLQKNTRHMVLNIVMIFP